MNVNVHTPPPTRPSSETVEDFSNAVDHLVDIAAFWRDNPSLNKDTSRAAYLLEGMRHLLAELRQRDEQ